ncbi:MAG: FKBP-type peptidyl-prolyl cis-trans isomerase [Paludibacteraceae bacterium]|nr:FKBP-type peptidyl-prolyl cis-trans isomerase [Paludibacteraceae bacterium]
MDSKIKIVAFCSLLFLLSGCKQNNWADWKVQNELWLEQKAQEAGVVKTSTGLLYKIISDPTPQDAKPNTTSTILCDYKVSLINGYVIEYQGPTFGGAASQSIGLSSTIPGFAEGCHQIHNNGDIEIYIPAYLGYDYSKYESDEYNEAEGYGTEGTTGYIPPYSTLIYEVHICAVSD